MSKNTFAIEWPDESGSNWMNGDNLIACLKQACPNTSFKVFDHNNVYEASCGPLPEPSETAIHVAARVYCDVALKDRTLDEKIVYRLARVIDEVLNEKLGTS